jgi:hypothetical protein
MKAIECVKIELGNDVGKERVAPYYLYGNDGDEVFDKKPPKGRQTLKACTYTDSGCSQGKAGCVEIEVHITGALVGPFRVYDADTNALVDFPYELEGTGELEYVCLPNSGRVNIEAFIEDICAIDSVSLLLTGNGETHHQTEYNIPYMLYGNNGSELNGRDGFETGVEYNMEGRVNDPFPLEDAYGLDAKFQFMNCGN